MLYFLNPSAKSKVFYTEKRKSLKIEMDPFLDKERYLSTLKYILKARQKIKPLNWEVLVLNFNGILRFSQNQRLFKTLYNIHFQIFEKE